MIEMIFSKVMETAVSTLAQAGFETILGKIKNLLGETDEKKRRKAFEKVFNKAVASINEDKLKELLHQDTIQEEIAVALLDPNQGFQIQSFSQYLGDDFPACAPALKIFFNALESNLMADAVWGPLLKQYQQIQFQKEVVDWMKNHPSATPRAWVKEIRTAVGSGASAQGKGATAVGERGVSTGDIKESTIITGTMYQIYIQPQGGKKLSPQEFNHILRDYLQWVVNAYSKVRLFGMESLYGSKGKAVKELEDVFIPISLRLFKPLNRDEIEQATRGKTGAMSESRAYLELVEKKQGKGEDVVLKRLFLAGRKLAIIGGAGSGKSTLLSHFALQLANSALTDVSPPFKLPGEKKMLIPLIIPLRYYRQYVTLCKQSPQEHLKNPRVGTLAGFVPWHLKRRSPALGLSEDFFDRLLLGGGCLLMIDGLDEVMSREDRGRVRQEAEDLANDIYPENVIVVTARESGYRENAIFGDDFIRFNVQRLTDPQISSLVENWCKQLYPGEVEMKTKELVQSIQHINNLRATSDLPPLVSTPLMTTMVVSVKWGETELPRERAKLYEAAVKAVLQSQYIPEDEARKELIEWGGTWEDQRKWLSYLAYEMHRGGQDGAAIPEGRFREILERKFSGDNLGKFIESVRYRGGLFEERAELFQFVHLTFQEFLAARYLAKERRLIFEEIRAHISDSWWREVLLLTYGFAKTDHEDFANEYLDWLSDLPGEDECRLAGLELAGSALLEIEKPSHSLKNEQADKLCKALFESPLRVSANQRVRSADTLARLGDPRPEVVELRRMQFCYVPQGEFIMGSDKRHDKDAREEGFPHTTLSLPGYYLERFPVTNAQFQDFIQGHGYETESYWTKAGWDWKIQEKISSLREFGGTFSMSNHPVVGVSWYEALAFTRWLTETWRHTGVLPEGWEVRLPSEAEWEKAAQGGLEIPVQPHIVSIGDIKGNTCLSMKKNEASQRVYPWGNDPDPNCANYDATGISATSAVGCFPSGASPYGCGEMSGNVWEWTRSLWGKNWEKPDFLYPYKPDDGRENLEASRKEFRVVRGGSFYDHHWDVRCSCRNGLIPDHRNYYVGFRVMLSPFISEL